MNMLLIASLTQDIRHLRCAGHELCPFAHFCPAISRGQLPLACGQAGHGGVIVRVPAAQVSVALLQLEMKQLVNQHPGRLFTRAR